MKDRGTLAPHHCPAVHFTLSRCFPKYFGAPEYLNHGAGVGKAGTLHLLRQGVRVVGTDAWSWDAPFAITGEKWKQSLREKNSVNGGNYLLLSG